MLIFCYMFVVYMFCCCLQVSKDAKECMQECVSEFISFITSEYPQNALCVCLSTIAPSIIPPPPSLSHPSCFLDSW